MRFSKGHPRATVGQEGGNFMWIDFVLFFFGSILLAEIIGPLAHRAEHTGLLGRAVKERHRIHHEIDYPPRALCPADRPKYRESGEWVWYIVAPVVMLVLFAGAFLLNLPLRYPAELSIGGGLYALFVVDYFHRAFHTSQHWLFRFSWFRRAARRHYIHHWKLTDFAIATPLMDRLMGTLENEFPRKPENVFP